jgi:hypothetical protein
MSKIALSGNASGTGTFTFASPNSNTDRTLTLPDSSGTVATAESTLSQFNASGSAPVYACRAWVNFNGTGTVAIRASGNVSSITDNGTGDYTVNFTTAMPDANYAISGAQGDTGTPNGAGMFAVNRIGSTGAASAPTTSACRVNTTNSLGNVLDNSYVNISIFR